MTTTPIDQPNNPYIMPAMNLPKTWKNNGNLLLKSVCHATGVLLVEIQGDSRKREIVYARHIFCYMASEKGFFLKQIAGLINRHHTSVIHGRETVRHALTVPSDELGKLYRIVEKLIG